MNEVVVRKGRDINVDLPAILHRTEGARKEPKKIFFPQPAESMFIFYILVYNKI